MLSAETVGLDALHEHLRCRSQRRNRQAGRWGATRAGMKRRRQQ
jgi:hypothetical protein